MHVENFKIFADLVESESFSRSAKLNGITQSAVSQQLRAMEKHFNVLIVDRSQKQFRLTREGQKIYSSSKEMLYLYDKLNSELQEMKKVISGTIHISTVYSIGLHELPPYVKAFISKFPDVNIRIEYRRANMVYEDILSNSIDLGLVAYPQKHKQLEILPFHDDVLVLVVSNHPLAKCEHTNLEALSTKSLLALNPTFRPTSNGPYFSEANIGSDPIMEFDNVETVKRAVEIDAGIAIFPRQPSCAKRRWACSSDPLQRCRPQTPLGMIHRKGRVLTPAMKKLIDSSARKTSTAF